MALTETQKKINDLYKTNFGRNASFGTTGGADYWANKIDNENYSWDDLKHDLHGSDEGKKHRGEVEGYTKGNVYIGGIDETKSIESQSGPGFWGDHFREGGVFEHMNAAGAATAAANNIKHTLSEDYFNNSLGGTKESIIKHIDGIDGIDGKDGKDGVSGDGWWNQFADADAFKKFLQGDAAETKSDGMGDFMKFMMLMNVMGGGRGGGGGYGGSQFGYGGMNPGGVQAAYDPMKQLQGMGTWFKDNFGSGSSKDATTQTINT